MKYFFSWGLTVNLSKKTCDFDYTKMKYLTDTRENGILKDKNSSLELEKDFKPINVLEGNTVRCIVQLMTKTRNFL